MSLSLHAGVNPGGQCLASLLCCSLKGSGHVERQEIRKDQEPILLCNHRAQCAFFLAMARVCSLMETFPRPLLLSTGLSFPSEVNRNRFWSG